jgi:hypothetical protein
MKTNKCHGEWNAENKSFSEWFGQKQRERAEMKEKIL